MQINWKEVCQCDGYKSLKAAMLSDIKKHWRDRKEARQKFKWVIGRATHYAHHLNKSIIEILNEWESKRKQWWLGYYDDRGQPRLNKSDLVKPMNPRNYYKQNSFYSDDPAGRKKRNLSSIMFSQAQNSKRKGNKARWPKEKIERQKRQKKSVS